MRCNAGIEPTYLTDQHLIAEYRELLIPGGQLIRMGFRFKTPIPDTFRLGAGHIRFWRDKHLYLKRRFDSLKEEMIKRGFKPTLEYWDLNTFPRELLHGYQPNDHDRKLIVARISERVREKPHWYRYYGETIDTEAYLNKLSGAFLISK